jgi:hypothetical protein
MTGKSSAASKPPSLNLPSGDSVLVARTYGRLRNEHGAAMAKRTSWGVSAAEPANVVPMTAKA